MDPATTSPRPAWTAPRSRAARSLWTLWLWLAVCLLPSALAWGADASTLVDVAALADAPLSLTTRFGVLEDPGGALTLADVSAAPFTRFQYTDAPAWSLNYGVTTSAYWLRLTLSNPSPQPFEGMLEFTYPRLAASVEVFEPDGQGGFAARHTGYRAPMASRAYKHHFYVFPTSLAPYADKTLYFRFQSDINLEIPGRLWRRDAFHAHERIDYASQALYYGTVIAMMTFNLLLFVALRNRGYFLYVCFGISSALSIAAYNGLGNEYLWGDHPYWVNISANLGYSLTMALGIVFMRSMIDTRRLSPRIDVALRVAIVVHLLLVLGIALSYSTFIRPQLALAGLTAVLVLFAGWHSALRGDRSALYFTAAFTVIAIGAAANSLRALGLIPTTFFSTNGIQIGSAAEMLLLAFALADRYNVIRREKEIAQRDALRAQQALVETLQSSERQLEGRVAERTEQLHELNARLEALSATDGLTGLANRRRFDEVLDSEWRRAQRAGRPLAVGVLDVDWFKNYNDTYGHLAGDDCLRQVAQVLTSVVGRAGDLAARYGGEEFTFIVLGTDGSAALAIAQRLCDALAALDWPHASSEIGHVSASVGVAWTVPCKDLGPLDLLKAADQALYQAKHQGRNRAVLYAPPDAVQAPRAAA